MTYITHHKGHLVKQAFGHPEPKALEVSKSDRNCGSLIWFQFLLELWICDRTRVEQIFMYQWKVQVYILDMEVW